MRMPCKSSPSLRDAIAAGPSPSGYLIGTEHRAAFGDLIRASAIQSGGEDLGGRSVLLAVADPYLAALVLVELDGRARRLTLYPPDLPLDYLPYVIRYAEVDAVVSDGAFLDGAPTGAAQQFIGKPAPDPRVPAGEARLATEWILLTSGTTGRPKMVLHTLASLTGAIDARKAHAEVVWGTFYDIRRYGGLQIFLRAVLTGSSLLLGGPNESLAGFLQRAGEAGVTHISGTPSHWRRALMSAGGHCIAPRYVRLSGEIADQTVLNSLRSFYPDAEISHAFATTEAGVAFDVRDGLSGFPAGLLTGTPGVDLKVVDATLRVRSNRTAQRYLGEDPPALKDTEGFVDTGDLLELCHGRYRFQGRRDSVINVGGLKVHPEEVEAVLNRHPRVRMSLVKTKKNGITGALVAADVLLDEPSIPGGAEARALQQAITQFCRASLAPHKVPVTISFVPSLALSETGKLARRAG